MKLQQLYSFVRRAIDDYEMIEEHDKIAVGISGGKDSLTLLYALAGMRRFYPKQYEIEAVTVDLGFDGFDLSKIKSLCEELDVHYTIVHTEIAKIVFQDRKETNPCSLCAKMRKGALNEAIKQLGCNKVAYAHHQDDVIETMLLSLIFEAEADVIGFRNLYNLPVEKSPCPADGYTKREYAKELLRKLNLDHPGTKERMFHAIINGNFNGWNQ